MVAMSTHIALSHTPFHLLQYGLIAAAFDDGDRMVVFHEGSVPDGIPGLESVEVVTLPGSTGYGDGRLVARANAAAVLDHSAWGHEAILYSSDLKWLTNNLVYFARPRSARRTHTVLVTDGLGSYLDRHDLVRTSLTATSKALLGLIGYGPRHRPLLGHHFGLDRRYAARVLGFRADRIVGDIDKLDLPLPHDLSPQEPGTHGASLVVGIPLDAHRYSEAEAHVIIDRMATTATELSSPDQQRWYKPHHFEAAWVGEAYQDRGFSLLTDRRPAEMLVRELGVGKLFGTYSSVLAFGPLFAGGACAAYSVCFEEFAKGYLNDADALALRAVLTDFGVTFV